MRPILCAASVTELGEAARGAVLVAGSHAGRIACYLGATAGAHALLLNDAGVGRDGAGIAGLAWLEPAGMAAAAVAHDSALIGDGESTLRAGVISHANAWAAAVGVVRGMMAQDAARRLAEAPPPRGQPPRYDEGRHAMGAIAGIAVWALDSVGKLAAEDAGRLLAIGSHGALHAGRLDSALNLAGHPVAASAAVFHDAGGRGVSRLPELERRGVPAAVVSADSARIGDGRSMLATGRISLANPLAVARGGRAGLTVADWFAAVAGAGRATR